jgi:ketosteroid isomerase-like protein
VVRRRKPWLKPSFDLNVTTHGELAFVHAVNHLNGALASGHITDLWVRWTACFRQIDGVWLVVHDRVSRQTSSMARLF